MHHSRSMPVLGVPASRRSSPCLAARGRERSTPRRPPCDFCVRCSTRAQQQQQPQQQTQSSQVQPSSLLSGPSDGGDASNATSVEEGWRSESVSWMPLAAERAAAARVDPESDTDCGLEMWEQWGCSDWDVPRSSHSDPSGIARWAAAAAGTIDADQKKKKPAATATGGVIDVAAGGHRKTPYVQRMWPPVDGSPCAFGDSGEDDTMPEAWSEAWAWEEAPRPRRLQRPQRPQPRAASRPPPRVSTAPPRTATAPPRNSHRAHGPLCSCGRTHSISATCPVRVAMDDVCDCWDNDFQCSSGTVTRDTTDLCNTCQAIRGGGACSGAAIGGSGSGGGVNGSGVGGSAPLDEWLYHVRRILADAGEALAALGSAFAFESQRLISTVAERLEREAMRVAQAAAQAAADAAAQEAEYTHQREEVLRKELRQLRIVLDSQRKVSQAKDELLTSLSKMAANERHVAAAMLRRHEEVEELRVERWLRTLRRERLLRRSLGALRAMTRASATSPHSRRSTKCKCDHRGRVEREQRERKQQQERELRETEERPRETEHHHVEFILESSPDIQRQQSSETDAERDVMREGEKTRAMVREGEAEVGQPEEEAHEHESTETSGHTAFSAGSMYCECSWQCADDGQVAPETVMAAMWAAHAAAEAAAEGARAASECGGLPFSATEYGS